MPAGRGERSTGDGRRGSCGDRVVESKVSRRLAHVRVPTNTALSLDQFLISIPVVVAADTCDTAWTHR